MKVITRFQSLYDKYLFEGIINPEDLNGNSLSFVGTSLNNQILNEDIVSLYVLNTLDHNIKIEPDNPDNILTKFFSSIQTSTVQKNLLLISVQHPKVLNDVIEYFSSLEKIHRPDESVIIYTISSLTLFSQLNDQIKNIIKYYGKHTYIDITLALTAIELFKRRKLSNIYNSELKGIGLDLLNHNDKKIKIQVSGDIEAKNDNIFKIFIPKIKINDDVLKNISEFLDKETNGSLKSEECFAKRLIPLIPKFNYRIYDKLETFALNNVSKSYNVLIINTLNLSFKNLLYISILKWNLIFITLNPESNVEYVYEKLSELYNSKSFDISKNELKKLNPDYSLLRSNDELEAEKHIFDIKDLIPHIMIDTLCGIKSYLKKLESSLEVDNIKISKLEI